MEDPFLPDRCPSSRGRRRNAMHRQRSTEPGIRGYVRGISLLSIMSFAVVLGIGRSAAGQTAFTFVGATSNLWNDPTTVGGVTTQLNWIPSSVPPAPPNDSTADVTIPSPFNVSVNGL